MESPIDVVVGEYYEVPYIYSGSKEIPILLPSHDNGPHECLSEGPKHFHVDYRFIEPYYDVILYRNERFEKNIVNAMVDNDCSIFTKKFKALRSYFDSLSTSDESGFFFINRWYRNNKDVKAVNRICPHKGTKIVNSCGTCPAHGLKWNLETEELDFVPPFYLELANNQISSPLNNRGIITDDDQCEIIVKEDFNFDGTVIMVDSLGNRYGKMFQKIYSGHLKKDNVIVFDSDKICSKEEL